MTRILRCVGSLRVAVRFVTMLVAILAHTALAQTPGAGQQASLVAPSFLPAVTYDSGGAGRSALTIGDLRGNGVLDLLVANECQSDNDCTNGTVGMLLGNGDGTFEPPAAFGGGGHDLTSLAIGDVNGDGHPDLAVASVCPNFSKGYCSPDAGYVLVLLGNGDGTFTSSMYYLAYGYGSYATSVALEDLRGNGSLDMVLGLDCWECGGDSVLSVWLGFQDLAGYGSGGGYQTTYWVAIGDVNGDGKPDLVAANQCPSGYDCPNGTVGVLLGNGDGTFQSAASYPSGGNTAQSVLIGDLNGDGYPDLAVANCGSSSSCTTSTAGVVGVLLGNGDGTFRPAVTYSSGGNDATSIVLADVNGDGHPDLVVANAGSNSVGVLLGKGDGTFASAVTFESGGGGAYSVAVADVNGDGKLDMVVANCSSSSCGAGDGNVGVLLNNTQYAPIRTSTALTSSPNPSNAGQVVTFTASVGAKTGIPTGAVEFFDSNLVMGSATLTNGDAAFSTSRLTGGSHSITARYHGDGKYVGSVSASFDQIVNKATTTTSLASSMNPVPLKEYVNYTATVTSDYKGAITGTVAFQDGGSTVATVDVNGGQAPFTTNYIATGSHAISASYSGDQYNAGSASATLTEQVITGVVSKTTLTTSGSPTFVGQAVTFTAKVTSGHGPIPDGELVMFYDGTTFLGSNVVSGGTTSYTTSSLSGKTHTIKATYPGDANFQPSTGHVKQIVLKYGTSTTLISDPNPSTYGQRVTFSATIKPSGPYAPTGRVKFWDGTTSIGGATLNNGTAIFKTYKLGVGTHAITAQYLGDVYNDKSTSPVVNQVVQ